MPQPLEVHWSPLAVARLRETRACIALDNPSAAARLPTRIVSLVEALRLHPHLGHSTAEANLRELPIGGTPYVIFYRIRRRQILITTVHHSARLK